MIQSSTFKPGRIYSVIYCDAVNMVQKRELPESEVEAFKVNGITLERHHYANGAASAMLLNPLADSLVTVRRVSSVQAAGGETWQNFKAKHGIETSDTGRKPWYVESPENDCIVVGITENTNGQKYLRGLPVGVTKEQYFIGGREASPVEVELIRAFKKSGGREALFVTLPLESMVNVVDTTE